MRYLLSFLIVFACAAAHAESPAERAARGVLERTIGAPRSKEFSFREIPAVDGKDTYEVEAHDGKVIVKGSSGVAMSRGAYDYLKDRCHALVTWEGKQIELPAELPDQSEIRVVCPNKYRHYFNVCTFGYTTVWWDWKRWQREIDWMALHGINMPLAMNGQEAIWQKVWKEFGMSQADIDAFFAGPAFLPWHRMGNINTHMGPLPQSWLDGQRKLQKQILNREWELGMSPVTPAFSGFLPPAFPKKHPQAQIRLSSGWAGFEPTILLDPNDPMYQLIGKRFLELYQKEYGTSHLYLADTFNEMTPVVDPDKKLHQLSDVGDAVYKSILAGDPAGTWVMQGWLFLNEADFWGKDEVAALLSPVPDDRMILIDLACDLQEIWRKHEAFRKKQWLNCTLHNFGQATYQFGDLERYASQPITALNDPDHGHMVGMGITPEGIEQNSIVYELATDTMWRTTEVDMAAWLDSWVRNRYGSMPSAAREAWQILLETNYGGRSLPGNAMYFRRPSEDAGGEPSQDIPKINQAVQLLLSCQNELRGNDMYRRDVVDVLKRYLEEAAAAKLGQAMDAEGAEAKTLQNQYLQALRDIDGLLDTRPEYRLGKWIGDARALGKTKAEKDQYEKNARMQITVWGGPVLYDYAAKEWAGLTRDFYFPRWQAYFENPTPSFSDQIAKWEEKWALSTGGLSPSHPGDTLRAADELFAKYRDFETHLPPVDRGIAVGKPVTVSGGTEPGHTPEMAVDGAASTGWFASPSPQWLQVDLQQPESISSIVLMLYADGSRYYQYTIQTSVDGKEWSTLVDGKDNSEVSRRKGRKFTFAPRQVRYIRVNMLKNSANIGVHLMELRVFR